MFSYFSISFLFVLPGIPEDKHAKRRVDLLVVHINETISRSWSVSYKK